jgi:hypothetical protein
VSRIGKVLILVCARFAFVLKDPLRVNIIVRLTLVTLITVRVMASRVTASRYTGKGAANLVLML